MVGLHHLSGVCGRGQHLGHQCVRIQRDRRHQLLQALRIERLRLSITLLRIDLAGGRVRLLRVRLLAIACLLIRRVLSVVRTVLRPFLSRWRRLLREQLSLPSSSRSSAIASATRRLSAGTTPPVAPV